MKIAVVGGTGNVGTALLRALKAASLPDLELVGLARRYPDDAEPYSGVQWISVDIASASSEEELASAFQGADVVVHLGWMIQPSHDRELLRRGNQGGSLRVFQAAARAGVGQLVYLSSVGTYAPAVTGTWVDESWPTTGNPESSYSVDKAAVERELDAVEGGSMTITRLRPGLILQPDAASEIGRYFLGRLLPLSLVRPWMLRLAPWPKEFAVQFVHADDVADAIVRVIQQGAGGAFNLASEPPVDRATLAETTGMSMPAAPVGLVRAGTYATWALHLQPTDVGWIALARGVPLLKTDRARNELGWQPRVPADVVLKDFVEALGRGRGTASPAMRPRNPFRKASV